MSTPEPLSPERLAEIRDLSVDSCSADAQYNPDVWELEKARTDLLAEVDRLAAQFVTIDRLNKVADADWQCEVNRLKAEVERGRAVVAAVRQVVGGGDLPSAWSYRWRDRAEAAEAERDRLKTELADLEGQNDMTESNFTAHVAESILEQGALTKRAEAAEAEVERIKSVAYAQTSMLSEITSACMAAEVERDARLTASDVERFLKRERDEYEPHGGCWNTVDDALDVFRLHMVTGTPLTEPRPSGGPEAVDG